MSRRCCQGDCSQGRGCPIRTVQIATRRNALERALDHWLFVALVYAVSVTTFIVANMENF